MRQLTSELRHELDQLGTGTVQETAEQLRHLGQSGEYILIPSLLRLMDDESLVIRQAAEQAVARLVEACPVSELVWLNEHVREWRPSPVIWKRVVEREVHKIDQASTIRLSMLTMHWSGFGSVDGIHSSLLSNPYITCCVRRNAGLSFITHGYPLNPASVSSPFGFHSKQRERILA
nr:hypothetical protein [Paenibacillus xylanexedens]